MKNRTLIFLCFATIIVCLYSCVQTVTTDKNNFRIWLNPDVKLENLFSVKLNIKVLLDDEFKIYYTMDNSTNFNEDRAIRTKVKGVNSDQTITFKFPKDVHPTNLRIDLGRNKNQKKFIINSIEFAFNNSNFKIPPTLFLKYFKLFGNQLGFDSSTFELKVLNNRNEDKYRPIIVSNLALSSKLKKLFNNSILRSQAKDIKDDNIEKNVIVVEFTQAELNQLLLETQIKSNIEEFNFEQNHLSLKGWAIFKDVNSKNTKIQLLLINNQTGYLIETLEKRRTDITSYFKLNYNADYSGFESNIDLSYIPKGKYLLGIWLKNDVENKNCIFLHKEEIEIQ